MRVLQAILYPILAAGIAASAVDNFVQAGNSPIVFLSVLGVISFLLGIKWYGTAEMGIRGGRPLMSGLSFAFLGWLGMLVARFLSVGWNPAQIGENLGITFLYLLIIQAICVQLWSYGLLFRALAAWRNPQTATLFSGIAFGLLAYYCYPETYPFSLSVLWTIVWGFMYAIIRLRTGSWLGIALVQAMQTLSVWYILPPVEPMPPAEMLSFYWLIGISGVVFLLVTWRLMPKYKSDLRV